MSFDNTNTSIQISLDDLHADGIKESLVAMAADKVTPGGTYLAKGLGAMVFENADGRQVVSLNVQVYNEDGREIKRIRVKVSPQARFAFGRVDKPTRLYLALAKAVEADPTSPAEVFTLANSSFFKVSFTDAYAVKEENLHADHNDKTANASGDVWITLTGKGDEAVEHRMHYLAAGYEPIYLTNNIFPEDA